MDTLRTLNDFQKLLGDVNWLRPTLKLTTGQLKPLFILKGDSSPNSPRQLTPEARECLNLVQRALEEAHLNYIDYSRPLLFLIFVSAYSPTGLFWQDGPLMWVYLQASPAKIVMAYPQAIAQLLFKAQRISLQTFGKEPDLIITPYTKEQLEHLAQGLTDWAILMCTIVSQFDNHYPDSKVCQFFKMHPVNFPRIIVSSPLQKARLVFTDGSSNGSAAVVSGEKVEVIKIPNCSAQLAELKALQLALLMFPDEPCNIYTDSVYVSQIVSPLETAAFVAPVSSICACLLQVQALLWQRREPIFVGHIRGHSMLPGPLAQGNELADSYTRSSCCYVLMNGTAYDKALQMHRKFHLNASSLRFHNGITKEQAAQIVSQCPQCAPFISSPNLGVNPRGLQPNDIWQMDVTHISSFGKLRFVHVSIDTYSGLLFASAHSGEKIKDVKSHCLQAFAFMGVPRQLKTDNGPAYTSGPFRKFCEDYDIVHKTGIPYNPQGQAIVERAHLTLKNYLEKTKTGDQNSPPAKLAFITYILNFLLVDKNNCSAADRHWKGKRHKEGMVRWKDLASGVWKGPDPVLVRVRGSACVFPRDAEAPIWIPERCVRPVSTESGTGGDRDPDTSGNKEHTPVSSDVHQ